MKFISTRLTWAQHWHCTRATTSTAQRMDTRNRSIIGSATERTLVEVYALYRHVIYRLQPVTSYTCWGLANICHMLTVFTITLCIIRIKIRRNQLLIDTTGQMIEISESFLHGDSVMNTCNCTAVNYIAGVEGRYTRSITFYGSKWSSSECAKRLVVAITASIDVSTLWF